MRTLALLGCLLSAAANAKAKVVVLDFAASGVEPQVAQTFSRLLATELARAGDLEVVSREDVAAFVSLERQKQLLGCSEATCLSELGGLLEARYVVTGALGKVGGLYVLNAQLLDSAKAQVQGRALRRAPSAEQLTAEAGALARELLAESAVLHLYNQVPGGAVFLDDKLVGKMPLDPLPLRASGRHRVRVESVDHLPWESEVELEPGRTSRVRVQLDRLDELEAHSRSRRWWGLGAGAAGLALGGVAYASLSEGAELKRQYDAVDPTEVSQPELNAMAASIRGRYALGYVASAAALAAVSSSVYLLLTDPYAARLELNPTSRGPGFSARLRVSPAAITLDGSF